MIEHAIEHAGNREDAANNSTHTRQKVGQRSPVLAHLHHHWAQVIHEEDSCVGSEAILGGNIMAHNNTIPGSPDVPATALATFLCLVTENWLVLTTLKTCILKAWNIHNNTHTHLSSELIVHSRDNLDEVLIHDTTLSRRQHSTLGSHHMHTSCTCWKVLRSYVTEVV